MSKGRIVFMGTPPFAVASLNTLVNAGLDVAAVVTAPDRPAGRGQALRTSAVKDRAGELGLPLLQPEKLRDPSFIAQLDALRASLYIVVAFRMLPEAVWSKPPLGTINLHASLLPDYRGAAPINWAIMNGEQRTGLTTFFIRQEIDTGDMLDQQAVEIGPNETAGELHDRMKILGGTMLVETVNRILDGTAKRIPQKGTSTALHAAPKLSPETCRIRWDRSARSVHDHIRGLSPVPGAWTMLRSGGHEQRFKVLRASMVEHQGKAAPGTMIPSEEGGTRIACGEGWIEATEVQLEGQRRMTAREFLNGLRTSDQLQLQ